MFKESYDWFLANYDKSKISGASSAHRKPVKEKVLKLLKMLSHN